MAKLYRSSGALVLRGDDDNRQVLVIHRPKYDDWSLPKGTLDDTEPDVVAAVREVREETGYKIRIVAPLSSIRYEVKGKMKVVTWWLAGLVGEEPIADHDDEADVVEWWPVARAIRELTYDDDVSVLVEGLRTPWQVPLLVVRHAKAIGRKNWSGDNDDERPLNHRGVKQAEALAQLLDAFGIRALASSSAERCMATLRPYSEKFGIEITAFNDLTEGVGETDPQGVEWAMSQIRGKAIDSQLPTAVCGHRPVLPTMIDYLGIELDHTLEPAEVLALGLDNLGDISEALHLPPEI